MLKRKNDEPELTRVPMNRIGVMALAIGLILLGVATTSTVMWLMTITPTPTHYPMYRTNTPNYAKAPTLGAVSGGGSIPTNVPLLDKNDARFVFSTADGTIMTNADGKGTRSTGLQGVDVVAAPDRESLAYLRSGQLYVYRGEQEKAITVSGKAMMPAWSADGNMLAFVVRESAGDSVYLMSMELMQPARLLTVPEIAAPPHSSPATARLLIVEQIAPKQTIFYTVDPLCATQSACMASRKDIATVNQTVSWTDYHPSATAIVFSDRDDGNLYLLSTADGKVESLAADGVYKRRPVFSRNGKALAYLTQNNDLFVLNLENKNLQLAAYSSITSADWVD